MRNEAITSWYGGTGGKARSGTKFSDPILLSKNIEHTTSRATQQHQQIMMKVFQEKERGRSHSVLVVDMSGSMRRDDVNAARCRSDGVWLSLARDFVKTQLEGKATTIYDLVSVVLVGETAEVPIHCEPMDWVLYNKLVDMREWTEFKPVGEGFYMPALAKAEELLNENNHGTCSLALFFSDGKPSDQPHETRKLPSTMGEIASRFGRRLIITCIGMADQNENFSVLKDMVAEAEAFGAVATFNKPSMSTGSLSNSITSSLVSSLVSTKTELTDLRTGKSRYVRTDVTRERRNTPDDVVLNNDWRIFRADSDEKYPVRVFAWHAKANDFVTVLDPRCVCCYKTVTTEDYEVPSGLGTICPKCRACFFCLQCMLVGAPRRQHEGDECQRLANERRQGRIVKRQLPSFGSPSKSRHLAKAPGDLPSSFDFLTTETILSAPKWLPKSQDLWSH